MSVDVRIAATPGLVTIAPPGSGEIAIPPTRLRVPAVLMIKVEPTGEDAEYSPLALELIVGLFDQITGHTAAGPTGGPFQFLAPGWVHIGDWRYEISKLTASTSEQTMVTPSALAAIRLPALLRRALRPVVLLVTDEGYSIDPGDLDERAIVAYVTAQLIGEHPTKAVAAELGINQNAAAQRVYRLRQDGRLPAVTKKGTARWDIDASPSASSPRDAGKPDRPASTRPPSTATTTPKRGASSSSSPAVEGRHRRRARPG